LPGQEWYVQIPPYERGSTYIRSFSVPVIAVFTKYDQFKFETKMRLEDEGRLEETSLSEELERRFHRSYLAKLEGSPPFVCLESEDFVNQLAFIMLTAVLQECTNLANGVLNLLKRL
jgi:hypothetical protein